MHANEKHKLCLQVFNIVLDFAHTSSPNFMFPKLSLFLSLSDRLKIKKTMKSNVF